MTPEGIGRARRFIRFYDEPGNPAPANPAPADPAPADPAPAQSWRDSLPDDLKSDTSLSKYNTLEDAARAFGHAQRLVGRPTDQIVELPKNGDADGRRRVLERLGLPKEPYALQPPEGAPEQLGADAPLTKVFTEAAYANGVLPDQAQAIYESVAQSLGADLAEQEKQLNARLATNEAELKTKWGEAYDQKIAAATYGTDKLGLREVLEETGMAAEPVVLEAMARVGEMLAEAGTGDGVRPTGKGSSFGTAMTPDEARSKAMELTQQATRSRDRSEVQRLQQEAARYFKIASGNKAI